MADALFPVPGQVLHMVRAGTTVTVSEPLKEGGQGVVYRAVMSSGAVFVVKWYRAASASQSQREAIEALVMHGRPHPAFIWPLDIVTCPNVAGFGYLMPLLEPRFVSFAEMLESPKQPTFADMAVIGRELVDAFAALHASGLCYRDISFGNLFVDPERGEVAVIDNDNVGTDGGTAQVLGHVALHGARDRAPGSSAGDRERPALARRVAVLPVRPRPPSGWAAGRVHLHLGGGTPPVRQRAGDHPLRDRPPLRVPPGRPSNRPVPGDPMLRWWPLYPRFFQDLFIRAFTVGLVDAAALRSQHGEPLAQGAAAVARLSQAVRQVHRRPLLRPQ